MNKSNVGDYIRIDGYISKIGHLKTSSSGKTYAQWKQPNGMLASGNIKIIPKSSPNIIELIEVGDYLNGWRVNEIERNNDNKNTIIKIGNTTFNVLENEEIYTPVIENDGYNRIEKLKSIVTKEQFSRVEYKVGDRDE